MKKRWRMYQFEWLVLFIYEVQSLWLFSVNRLTCLLQLLPSWCYWNTANLASKHRPYVSTSLNQTVIH